MSGNPLRRREILKVGASGAALTGIASQSTMGKTATESPTVYIGCSSDDFTPSLYALDAETGDVKWQALITGEVWRSSPIVVDGIVYVGASDRNQGNRLYAMDATSGTERWGFDISGEIRSSPTVVDGTVFIGSEGGSLYAVDTSTGEQNWVFTQPGGAVFSSPAVVNGTVYVGSDDTTLYAIDAVSGDSIWTFTGSNDVIRSSPTVVEETVYVGSLDGTLYAVDVSDGDLRWAFSQPDDGIFSSPTVVDETVFVGCNDETLYAVNAVTGDLEWEFTRPNGAVTSSPTVVGGTVYVGSSDGNLYAVDADSGSGVWTFTEPEASLTSSPTVANGLVYIGSSTFGHKLYAVDKETGHQEWVNSEPTRAVRSSPTVVDDPEDGDSIDSRVHLGTLGHHHEWADQEPDPGDPTEEGIVEGIVSDFDGTALEGATITAVETDGEPEDPVATTTTDANGRYTIELPAGITYEITASLDGYTSTNSGVTVNEDESHTQDFTLEEIDDNPLEDIADEKRNLASRLSPDGIAIEFDEREDVDATIETLETAIEDDEISGEEAVKRVERMLLAEEVTDAALTVTSTAAPREDTDRPEFTLAQNIQEAAAMIVVTKILNDIISEYVVEHIPRSEKLSELDDLLTVFTTGKDGEPEGVDDILFGTSAAIVDHLERDAIDDAEEGLNEVREELAGRGYARLLQTDLESTIAPALDDLNDTVEQLTAFDLSLDQARNRSAAARDEIYEIADETNQVLEEFSPIDAIRDIIGIILDILAEVGETVSGVQTQAVITIPVLVTLIVTAIKILAGIIAKVAAIERILSVVRGTGAITELKLAHRDVLADLTAVEGE